ncbi:MAG: acyl-CoA/acyl-ACP dehydrogenase [Bradyrhizobium sp.]|uniref:acyl-CoA dehydrogenase family protein n=1 Tax=Bradyrhizobium sp. TaxID=376 RepID=UPI0025C68D3A|nr:acyl-CoA dehydrogenase family protein [Bradyrhizobium sp.]MBI5264739.1 acyl-CoA/acyl-ACP dehydrogenase [Bradyrhizobium sp.]
MLEFSADAPATPSAPASREELLAACRALSDNHIRVLAREVDQGLYPIETLRKLGAAGAFAQHLQGFGYSREREILTTIEAMAVSGEHCGCTSFLMWLQNAFGWYLEMSENTALRESLQPLIASGTAFGTSAMSNPVKAMDGIENFRLRGERVDGGYVVTGVLPYVSNLGDGHYLGTAFELVDKPEHRIMCVMKVDGEAVKITQNVHFICLEGSGTYTVQVRKAFVPDAMVLADPIGPFVARIKPTFFLLQAGIALGQIQGCINIMNECDQTHLHVNKYLPMRQDYFAEKVDGMVKTVVELLKTPFETSKDYLRQVYQARLAAGDVAMECANSAMMHAGAKGYILGSDADRRLRETIFVAIVTPALRHLRKTLAEMDATDAA